MKIAIASGKGGTGKTSWAISMALSIQNTPLWLLDCDVEAPNLHLFLPLQTPETSNQYISLPQINKNLCNGCGKCIQHCEYQAIIIFKQKAIVFPELCHACGACSFICPEKAIQEVPYPIGTLSISHTSNLHLVQGCVKIGSTLSVPLIKAVKQSAPDSAELVLIDCPPGTSCPMVHSVLNTDAVVLVSEPTPFGLHDLKLAIATLKKFYQGFVGIVINRCNIGDKRTEEYCTKENLPILMKIPEDREIAKAYAKGIPMILAKPDYQKQFQTLMLWLTNGDYQS